MTGCRRFSPSKSHLANMLMHTGELRFAKELREAPAMELELKDFRWHVSEAGRYSFEARSGTHDDLVLAVAIALWRAVKKNFAQLLESAKGGAGLRQVKGGG